MIRGLILLLLPALFPSQDDAARKQLQKMEEALGKAKTVTLRCKTEVLYKVSGEKASLSTLILFKGSRVSVAGSQKAQEKEEHFAYIVEDNRLQADFAGNLKEILDLPKEYPADLQGVLLRTGAFPLSALMVPGISGERVRTPGKIIETSELRLGEDARSLTYVLKFKGIQTLERFGGIFSCTLRFDPDTGKMTGRTLVATVPGGETFVITETYDLSFDAEISDNLLKLPLRPAPKPGGYKPSECFNNQCYSDLADAKEGRWVTYLTQAGGSSTRLSTRVVGKVGGDWLIESWMDTGALKYGTLFRVGADRVIKKAWAAAEGDLDWALILVKEPPKQAPAEPKTTTKESDEKKVVKAGSFDCRRFDVTVTVQGKDYTSSSWYSKDVWKLWHGNEKGGVVAMQSSGSTFILEAKGEDAKPTIPLPKE